MSKFPPAKVLDLRSVCTDKRVIITSDIHGCFDELEELLLHTRFNKEKDILIVAGDYVDRGPKIKEVCEFMQTTPNVYGVLGNHDDRLLRYLKHRDLSPQSLERMSATLAQCDIQRDVLLNGTAVTYLEWLEKLPHIIRISDNQYVVHAGIHPHKSMEEQSIAFCLYCRQYDPAKDNYSSKEGENWYKYYSGNNQIFFGHAVHEEGITENPLTIALDGGCVFGGVLRGTVLERPGDPGRIFEIYAKKNYYKYSN